LAQVTHPDRQNGDQQEQQQEQREQEQQGQQEQQLNQWSGVSENSTIYSHVARPEIAGEVHRSPSVSCRRSDAGPLTAAVRRIERMLAISWPK
jgi:transcription elongation GreA/GreB family factor